MTPGVSVVVPAYNAARTVESTINSILLQSFTDFELVVVDDGSEDETAALVTAFDDPRIRLVRQENTGLAGARNSGVAVAQGGFVAFLDADDLWLPDHLAAMTRALASDPGASVAYADAWVLDHATGRIRRASAMAYHPSPSPLPVEPDVLFRRLLEGNFIVSSATIRRDALEQVGGYRAELRRWEDYELWLRMAAHGHHFVEARGRLWVHREIHGSLSDNLAVMVDAGRRVYDIVATTFDVSDDLRRLAAERRDEYAQLHAKLTDPSQRTLRDRAVGLARRARNGVRKPRLWLPEPPPDVAALLAAVGDPSLRIS